MILTTLFLNVPMIAETHRDKIYQRVLITHMDYKSPTISVDPTVPEMLATLN